VSGHKEYVVNLTDSQYAGMKRAAERVAAAVAREVAAPIAKQEARAAMHQINYDRKKPRENDLYQCAATKDWFTYAAGEWRRESPRNYEMRMTSGRGFFDPSISHHLPKHSVYGEPCKMNFAPCPPIEYHESSQLGKLLRTTKRPDLPTRSTHDAPVSIPTTGFYMVVDARCYPEGAGPDNKHPWFLYPPKMLHATEDFALQEATRLSTEHGVPFIVLTSVKMVDVKPATTKQTDMTPVAR
jgi:hypothetical protein